MLEHLSEREGRRAIANICGNAGDVLFSSTPDDVTEPTHVNVRPSLVVDRALRRARLRSSTWTSTPGSSRRRRCGFEQVALGASCSTRCSLSATRSSDSSQLSRGEGGAVFRPRSRELSGQRDRLQGDLAAVQRGAEALRHELTARRLELTALRQEGEQLRQAIGAQGRPHRGLPQRRRTSSRAFAKQRRQATPHRGSPAERADKDAFIAGLQRTALSKDDLITGLNSTCSRPSAPSAGSCSNACVASAIGCCQAIPGGVIVYRRIRRPSEVLLDEEPDARLPQDEEQGAPEGQCQRVLVKALPRVYPARTRTCGTRPGCGVAGSGGRTSRG